MPYSLPQPQINLQKITGGYPILVQPPVRRWNWKANTMKNIRMTPADSSIENTRSQLDLGFNGAPACERPAWSRRQILRSRASWWFQQMRRAVDSAVEWRPSPPVRPEQRTLDLRRQTEVTLK